MVDRLILSWHIFPILLLYPIWGVIQQFMIVGIIAGNLRTLDNTSISKWKIIIVTAFVFAIVHFPSLLFLSGTFLLALVYTNYFIKYTIFGRWVFIMVGWAVSFLFCDGTGCLDRGFWGNGVKVERAGLSE